MEEKILLVLIFIIASFLVFSNSAKFLISQAFSGQGKIEKVENVSQEYPIAKVPLEGFIQANISVDAILIDRAQVSLRAGCYLIQATTDACVASAIEKGLREKVEFRPTIYDVIIDAFRNLGIKVLAVKIVEMKENTFIGQLIIQQKDKVLVLDVRPSDATAIALRVKAPIYINETLAKEVGKYIC
jgi:bifunctional DNase/RNase